MAIDPTDFLEPLKEQCNVIGDDDNGVLTRICRAAVVHTEADLGLALDDVVEFPTGVPDDLHQAVLMLAAHWYENREATLVGVTAQPIPYGYAEIIANHRTYTYG